MMLIARRTVLLAFFTLTLALAACSNRKVGAGGRDTKSASGVRLTAIYGLRAEERLGFLILVQFPTPGAATYASSKWVGSATHESGTTVAYEASLSDVDINGTTFVFDNGRVFFVKAGADSEEIHQLDLEVGAATYDAEIERLATSPEIDALVE